jgi:hypothetical protein
MIYTVPFAVYERLASAKMNALLAALNSHTHDGLNGAKVRYEDLDGSIDFLANTFNVNTIDGSVIITNTLPATKIINHSITMTQIDNDILHSGSLKLDADGYAVYAE